MIGDLFSIMAPVFVCAAVGYVWKRAGWEFPTDAVRLLIAYIGAPCLVFSTLTGIGLKPELLGTMAAIAALSIAVSAAVGSLILAAARLSGRTYLPTLMFPNTGNMGLPLCLFAFGETGLALAIAFYFVIAVGQYTIGAAIPSGSATSKQVLRSPIVYAGLVAVILVLAATAPPTWIANTTRLLGGMTIPLLLITLGSSLATLTVHGLKRSVALSLVRLTMGFAIGVGLAWMFGLEGVARGVVILQSSMPAAVLTYLFAQEFLTEPEEVAGIVVVSTLLSFASLPILLWYVL